MNIKKNDTVVVLSGKDKGKKGKVLVAMPSENKVIVEGVNVATCHTASRAKRAALSVGKSPSALIRCSSSAPSAASPPASVML